MTHKNPIRAFSGGRASRAEVYGLFIAAIVLIGGGVGGAIAYTNGDLPISPVTTTESSVAPTDTATSAGSDSLTTNAPTEPAAGGDSISTEPGGASSNSTTNSPSNCPYTTAQQNYYNNIRATKQAAVDQAEAQVANVNSWIASNTAHLAELEAAPYRPIEVFQWHPDGTPMSYRVDSNDEIAFERQRIIDNQSELVRAEEALRQAIAARDLIPGC